MTVRGFFQTLAFLTRIPVPTRWRPSPDAPFCLEGVWFPAAGAVIGGFLCSLAFTADHLFPARPGISGIDTLLILLLWAGITGGLHLDGVADVMECALSPVSFDEKRRIRKDPRKGVFAILSLIFLLLAKGAAILAARPALLGLFLAPLLARALVIPLFRTLSRKSPPDPAGLGAAILAGSLVGPATGLFLSLLLAGFLGGARTEGVFLLAAGATFGLGRWVLLRIDSPSGDLAGLLIEFFEVFFLLFLSLWPLG